MIALSERLVSAAWASVAEIANPDDALFSREVEHATREALSAALRVLADGHSENEAHWRSQIAKHKAGDEQYLIGYVEALKDMSIGMRRLALAVNPS